MNCQSTAIDVGPAVIDKRSTAVTKSSTTAVDEANSYSIGTS